MGIYYSYKSMFRTCSEFVPVANEVDVDHPSYYTFLPYLQRLHSLLPIYTRKRLKVAFLLRKDFAHVAKEVVLVDRMPRQRSRLCRWRLHSSSPKALRSIEEQVPQHPTSAVSSVSSHL
jgi:hypothetical protein